jgi:signal transduction histidine kinase
MASPAANDSSGTSTESLPAFRTAVDPRVVRELWLLDVRRAVLLSGVAAVLAIGITLVEVFLPSVRQPVGEVARKDWYTLIYGVACALNAGVGAAFVRRSSSRFGIGPASAVAFIVLSLCYVLVLVAIQETRNQPELYYIMAVLVTGGMIPLPPLLFAGLAGAGGGAAIITVYVAGAGLGGPALSASLILLTTFIAIIVANSNYSRWRSLFSSQFAAEDAQRERDRFMRITAHDLRNPIGTIPDFVRLIRQRLPEEAERDLTAEFDILEMTARATRSMLDNLLLWGQSATGELEPQWTAFDVSALATSVTDRMAAHIHLKSIELTVEVDEPCIVTSDAEFVRTIVHNLIANAVKFTPEHKKITVSCTCDDDRTLVEVDDTGIGMAEVDHPAQRSGTAGERGTGLGLQLIETLAQKIGATLELRSTPGSGTHASLRIPRKPVASD